MKTHLDLPALCAFCIFIWVFTSCNGSGPNIKFDDSNVRPEMKEKAQECFESIKAKIEEAAKKLDMNLKGKNISIKLGRVEGGGAETKPDLDDNNGVIITIDPGICELVGTETFTRLVAHELVHVQQLTTDPPGPSREKYKKQVETDKKASAAAAADAPDKNALKKKALQAEKEELEQLKKDEAEAHDFTDANKDKLGLSDDEVKKNKEAKEKALKELDEKIKRIERLISLIP